MDVPLAEGKVLGERYLVERMLGAGGMSVVAAASDLAQQRRVAIKMLLPHSAKNSSVVQRFQREQRTLQQLTNEHAVRLYGAGTEGEHPYMVLEYLVGSDLSEVLKTQGALPVEEAIDYILQASEAIAEAHALGITHRDLKPGNLFLTRRPNGAGSIKVLDFGISKATGPQRELGESTLTGTSAILGSPFYMSPEQLLSSRDVDSRTDVWSLGVTLYELLTNTLPFGAKNTQKVCKRILNDKPTPLREIRPDMPEELDHALLKSLQRRPAQRYKTVTDMAIRLAPFGPPHAGESVTIISEFLQPTERRGSRVPEPPSSAPGSAPAASFEILDLPTQDAQTLHVERRTSAAPRTKTVVIAASAATLVLGLGAGIAIGRATADRSTTTDQATTARLSATSPPADEASAGSDESKDDDTAEPGEQDEEPVAELPREVDLDLDAPPMQPPRRPPGGTPAVGSPRPPSAPSTTGAPQATAPEATSEPTATPTPTTTQVASSKPKAPPTQPKVDEVPDF